MKLLKKIYRTEGINLKGKTIHRKAVRGIILKGKKILLIYSPKNGDYKFPGGGLEQGESKEETLIREIKEETGASISIIDEAFGKVIEYDKDQKGLADLFKMTSYYYLCQIDNNFEEQKLDLYEKKLGFTPKWVTIEKAITTNKSVLAKPQNKIPQWTVRDTYILEEIKNYYHL